MDPLAQLGDALCSVGAAAPLVEATEVVTAQAAKERRSVKGRRHYEANTMGATAHFSSLSTPLPLMQLATMMDEATPNSLRERSIVPC